MKWYLIAPLLILLYSCSEKSENEKEETPVQEEELAQVEEVIPQSVEDEFILEMSDTASSIGDQVKTFVPEGMEILDFREGDLNLDGYNDVVLVLRDEQEESEDFSERARPVKLLIANKKGFLTEVASNNNIVLCAGCGGMFDPYEGIAIKDGYFSLEHYGGSGWRWTRIITFKYQNDGWVLHKDGGVSYHASNPDDVEETVLTKDDFGTVLFEDYNLESLPL